MNPPDGFTPLILKLELSVLRAAASSMHMPELLQLRVTLSMQGKLDPYLCC